MEEHLHVLERWYEQYGEAVHRRCLRILGEQAAAWDSTQEVFVRAYRALDTFRQGSVLSFLLTIADRYCFAQLRRQRSFVELSESVTASANGSSFQEAMLDDDIIRRLLAHADSRTQHIVALRFFEERELEEIAQTLGISRKTVHRKLERFYESARKRAAAWQMGRRI